MLVSLFRSNVGLQDHSMYVIIKKYLENVHVNLFVIYAYYMIHSGNWLCEGVSTRSKPNIKPNVKPLKVVTAINNILFI